MGALGVGYEVRRGVGSRPVRRDLSKVGVKCAARVAPSCSGSVPLGPNSKQLCGVEDSCTSQHFRWFNIGLVTFTLWGSLRAVRRLSRLEHK